MVLGQYGTHHLCAALNAADVDEPEPGDDPPG
jgi:hypothetical protein